MADINFGILDTQAPGRIAAIPQQAQAQQTQNMLTALQAQQTMRQGEVSQMQLQKMKQSEAALEKIRQASVSLGGPPNLRAIANAYLSSGDPEHQKFGVGLVKELDQQDQFKSIMQGPTNNLTPQPAPAPMGAAPAPMEAAPANNLAPKVQGLPSNVLEMQNKRDRLIALGTPQALAMATAIERSIEQITKPFMHNVPNVGTVDAMGRTIIPAVEPKGESVKEYEYAKKQGFTGTLLEFKQQLAKAGRAQAQPVAPTITQIVDPSNPNQMITIDARRYTGGGSGSAGVIGVSGKEPTAALRENKQEAGKTLLADEISNLRNSLSVLNRLKAIPSTGRGVVSNLSSSTQASGVGQFLGKVSGTEAQTERDLISSSKLRLVNAIKQATGMSAQQLNSNVELQTMLKSLSDPSQAIETNTRNLDNLETAYVKSAPPAPGAAGAGVDKSNPLLR